MSDQTFHALEEALKAHVADECEGALVTGWVGVSAYITDDPESDHCVVVKAENQMKHSTIGLFHVGLEAVNMQQGWEDDD